MIIRRYTGLSSVHTHKYTYIEKIDLHLYIYIHMYAGMPVHIYMGGCQNYGPFLGPYYNTAPII